jgi:hypothetical protein
MSEAHEAMCGGVHRSDAESDTDAAPNTDAASEIVVWACDVDIDRRESACGARRTVGVVDRAD